MPSQKDTLLRILNEAEQNKVEGRTRLQKLVFLAQAQTEDDSEPFDFRAYDYGPFSADILHELDDLKSESLVEEEVTRLPKGKKYTYTLTEEGKQKAENVELNSSLPIEDVVKQFNSMPISRLLEHVYNKFPSYTVNSKL